MSADLMLYGPPSASDLEQSWRLAERIARTDFVPSALRGKPEAVLACILAGRELGIGPMQALQSIHVIQGRPTMSADLMVGLVRRQGHRIRTLERTDTTATVEGVRADDPQHTESITFTMDDAKRAGLTGKDNWRQYPAAMLWARAVSALCRIAFNDVLHGVAYTPEEISPDTPASTAVQAGRAEIDGEPFEGGVPKRWAIDNIRDPEDARWLLQQPEVSDDYREAVKARVAHYDRVWPQFWWNAEAIEWRGVLGEAQRELTRQQSDPGSDPTSGAGERRSGWTTTTRDVRDDPAPDPTTESPSTLEPEASPTEADRSRVEGANSRPGADPETPISGDATAPPGVAADAPRPQPPGGLQGSRPARSPGKAAAGRTTTQEAGQAAFEQGLAGGDPGRFAR